MIFEKEVSRKPMVGDLVWYHTSMDKMAALVVDVGAESVTILTWDKLGNPKPFLGVPQTDKDEPFRWSWRLD